MRPRASVPDRPPLPLSLCGYRCGYGCEEPLYDDSDGSGGGSEAGTDTTYVDYDVERNSMTDIHHAHNEDDQIAGEQTSVVLLEAGPEAQHGSELSEHSNEDYTGYMVSLDVGPCSSRSLSRAASSRGSVRVLTPGPGIGVWAEDGRVEHVNRLPLEYHFLQKPLRLSPQYQDCRGNFLSHMIVPDRPLRAYT